MTRPLHRRTRRTLAGALVLAALWASSAAEWAAHAEGGTPGSKALQGDRAAWVSDPHVHAFYELSRRALAGGPAGLDRERYMRDARAIFRDMGPAMGVSADVMEAHLRLIPGQVIDIATADPSVLRTYEGFVNAVLGPP